MRDITNRGNRSSESYVLRTLRVLIYRPDVPKKHTLKISAMSQSVPYTGDWDIKIRSFSFDFIFFSSIFFFVFVFQNEKIKFAFCGVNKRGSYNDDKIFSIQTISIVLNKLVPILFVTFHLPFFGAGGEFNQ